MPRRSVKRRQSREDASSMNVTSSIRATPSPERMRSESSQEVTEVSTGLMIITARSGNLRCDRRRRCVAENSARTAAAGSSTVAKAESRRRSLRPTGETL